MTPSRRALRGAHEVLAALTLPEKVAFLHQYSPAVERLGLAAFTTGTEALHGLAWLGTATVFPQPPGLAASWDPELLTAVGAVTATEVRAKHAQDPTVSLNVWAPVVNTLRHPLWGRGEEGYSEDPDVTAGLATAYCRGLRGDHPTVWKTVPTLKHFCAYGNEVDRAVTSSHLPPQTLRETELPAFTGPLRAGVVGAVMPSYNLVNGRPNHVAAELLDELRSWAPGSIAVVSDAQAPSNLVDGERYHPDHVRATAAALTAGIDSFTDNDARSEITVERVTAALAQGLVTEADVDTAVLRLLQLRERTGELAAEDPYGIGPDAIDLPEHRALAREASGRGVVVLANDGPVAGTGTGRGDPVLPLDEPGVVAVVGPFADHVVTDWYSGTPPYAVTIADAVRERYPDAQVRVADGGDEVALRVGEHVLAVSPDGDVVTASEVDTAHDATRFTVTDWGHDVVTLRSRSTGRLLTGASWIVAADADRVGGWVTQETFRRVPRTDGVALLHLGSGRWLRVQLGSRLLVTEPDPELATVFTVQVLRSGAAAVRDACAGADVAIVALGNDPHVHGRETADRPELGLPAPMRATWRTALDACPAAVLTLVSSYPYAVAEEAARAAAVVWTSHAGQELGHGLLDVLAGDRVPTGRLPQTWWADEADAGDILDYDVVTAGQTYRYNPARPLFGIGHGLGYSRVAYESLTLSATRVDAPAPSLEHVPARWHGPADGGATGDSAPGGGTSAADDTPPAVDATVVVRNTGQREADELVAVWSQAPDLPVRAPRTRLLAWTRVRLAPGERAAVTLPVPPGTLAVWDVAAGTDGERGPVTTPGAFRVQPGTYRIASGPSAADLPVGAELVVVGPDRPVRGVLGTDLAAAAFSDYDGVVTSDRSRRAGDCVEVALGQQEGWARYGHLDVAGAARVRLRVARRRLPASTAARVALEVRPAGSAAPSVRVGPDGPTPRVWHPLTAPVEVPDAPDDVAAADRPYAWHDVVVPITGDRAALGDGPVDVRVVLGGAARLAELRFLDDAAPDDGPGDGS